MPGCSFYDGYDDVRMSSDVVKARGSIYSINSQGQWEWKWLQHISRTILTKRNNITCLQDMKKGAFLFSISFKFDVRTIEAAV